MMKIRSWLSILVSLGLIYSMAITTSPGQSKEDSPTPVDAPSVWATPLSLDFGIVGIGQTSPMQTVTIKNVGTATLLGFSCSGLSYPFAYVQNCAFGVQPGDTCWYKFSMNPTSGGVFSNTVTVSTDAGDISIQLRGEGLGARVHANAHSLDFGRIGIGGTGTQQDVTIHNTGLADLEDFSYDLVNPPFSVSTGCWSEPPGSSCKFNFNFSPDSVGLYTDVMEIDTNAGPISIDLQGRGVKYIGPSQFASPLSLDFGPVQVGTKGTPLEVTVTNQSPTVSLHDWTFGEVDPPFGFVEDCTPSVPIFNNCTIIYTFFPFETGVFTAVATVTNSVGSFSIDLRGESVSEWLHVSPLVLDFGYTGNWQPQVVTVKNMGSSNIVAFTGGDVELPFSFSEDCSTVPLPPGGTCEYTYDFDYSGYGQQTATSTVSTSAGDFSIQLIGGLDGSLVETSFTPYQITLGETTVLEYKIHNQHSAATLFNLAISNDLPAGLKVADPPLASVSPGCNLPDFSPSAGDTSILLQHATLLSGEDCNVQVSLTAEDTGEYVNFVIVSTDYTGMQSYNAKLIVGSKLYLPIVMR